MSDNEQPGAQTPGLQRGLEPSSSAPTIIDPPSSSPAAVVVTNVAERPSRPVALKVILENIPQEMMEKAQWLGWRYDWREGGKKWTKPPINVLTGRFGSSTAPSTWSTFAEVVAAYKSGRFRIDGIGFVLKAGDDIFGIDIDHCLNGSGPSELAKQFLANCPSYTERSPSGEGLHILGRGARPPHFTNESGKLEIYDSGRFLCVTGNQWEGTPTTLERLNLTWYSASTPASTPDDTLHGSEDEPVDAGTPVSAATPDDPVHGSEAEPADASDLSRATQAVSRLSKHRCDDYEGWLHTGMSLYELGIDGLNLWETWSRQSDKYEPGRCAEKWATFKRTDGFTLGSLFHWAEEDSGIKMVRQGTKGCTGSHYLTALASLGYTFTQNAMNDVIYVSGNRLTDTMAHVLMYELRENGYRSKETAEDAWTHEAYMHRFHPIRDYLSSLVWDGQDHIGRLVKKFKDKDGFFPTLLKRWMIGAITRVMGPRLGQHHPMLVLDGKQGIGKSRWAWWMCSPLPGYFRSSQIVPEDKDYLSYLCSNWIWEVDEIGATTRKADREALKAFISKEAVTVRKAYGRYDFEGPPTVSFIGTFNNENGYLSDPTGDRRYWSCELQSIDWSYSKPVEDGGIDINQVWAQAVHLFRNKEPHELTDSEEEKMKKVNARYEVDDSLKYHILKSYIMDGSASFATVAEIEAELHEKHAITGNVPGLSNRIAGILRKGGCERHTATINGSRVAVWSGIRRAAVTEATTTILEPDEEPAGQPAAEQQTLPEPRPVLLPPYGEETETP